MVDINDDERQALRQIDAFGYGEAQFLIMSLTTAGFYSLEALAYFAPGGGVTGPEFTEYAAQYYGVKHDGFWPTAILSLGEHWFIIGGFAGMILSDTRGRRPVILLAYATTALGAGMYACAGCYLMMGIGADLVLLGIGGGFTSAIAMCSECTPWKFRMPQRAIAVDVFNMTLCVASFVRLIPHELCFQSSSFLCSILTVFMGEPYEPRLRSLPILLLSSLWWGFAYLYLPESPVFLASVGRRGDAEVQLTRIGKLNGFTGELKFFRKRGAQRETPHSFVEKLEMVFSMSKRAKSAILLCLIIVFCKWRTLVELPGPPMFFSPITLGAWYDTVVYSLCIPIEFFALLNAVCFSRSRALSHACAFVALTMITYAALNPLPMPRNICAEVLLRCADFGLMCGVRVTLSVVYQCSVEIFPAWASVTGGSIIIGSGYVPQGLATFAMIFDAFGTGALRTYIEGMVLMSIGAACLAFPLHEGNWGAAGEKQSD